MKNQWNVSQLVFLSQNRPTAALSDYYDFPSLLDTFLTHLQDYLRDSGVELRLSNPFLSHDFGEPVQSSSVTMGETPLGNMYLYHHSFPLPSSLVYHSSSSLLQTIILQESAYRQCSVSDYVNLIKAFSSMLTQERTTYNDASSGVFAPTKKHTPFVGRVRFRNNAFFFSKK